MVFNSENYHKPVLLDETISLLGIIPNGVYVDGTLGGGGHSRVILSKLTTGLLVSIDRDPDSIAYNKVLEKNKQFIMKQANFIDIADVLSDLNITCVDGVLLDLGVSSHQLDTPERGFSYHYNASLDMRMSQNGFSAYDLVNNLSCDEIAEIIFKYGEDNFAKVIANAIVKQRQIKKIDSTEELANIIKSAVPSYVRRRSSHPARKTFQAFRIAVNDELGNLSKGLEAIFCALKAHGRLAVITFHSLEDRIVKTQMKQWSKGCICPPDFPVCICGNKPKAKVITRKPIVASEKELAENIRSRSAKLRVCEKLSG